MYIKDPYFPAHSHFRHNSITIALSVSGEGDSTVTHLNQLKQEGSRVISITNHKHSTIAKMSDVNISYYVTENGLKMRMSPPKSPLCTYLNQWLGRYTN